MAGGMNENLRDFVLRDFAEVCTSPFQAAMFPPALYSHLKAAGKDMIVVLNKVDLVPLPVVIAWKHSLLEAYPGIRRVLCYRICTCVCELYDIN